MLITSTEGVETSQVERCLLVDHLLAVDDVYTLRQEGGVAVHPYAAEAVDEVLLHGCDMVDAGGDGVDDFKVGLYVGVLDEYPCAAVVVARPVGHEAVGELRCGAEIGEVVIRNGSEGEVAVAAAVLHGQFGGIGGEYGGNCRTLVVGSGQIHLCPEVVEVEVSVLLDGHPAASGIGDVDGRYGGAEGSAALLVGCPDFRSIVGVVDRIDDVDGVVEEVGLIVRKLGEVADGFAEGKGRLFHKIGDGECGIVGFRA